MHVAVVSPYDPRPSEAADPRALRGGVEESLDRMARGLAARGHEVTVVTSAREASDTMESDGIRFLRVKRRLVLFRNPVAPLARHIPRDAEVVHVPATYPGVSDLVPLRETRRGRATVLDYHFDVHGTSAAMRVAARAHLALLGSAMFRATRIVAKSLDYARHSPVLGRVAPERLDWVPNGVDMQEFPMKAARGEDVLCVGRLVPYKGVDVLVRAAPLVHEETGARVRIAGDGPERARLERLAREIDAPVEFLGRVPREDIPRLYAEARVSVLPSVNGQEAFGITLLESMAAGTPVVASDLPGVREVAREAGRVAPPGDAEALAREVVALYEDPRALGSPTSIRNRVASRYSWPAVVARLEDVYERALASAASARRPAHRTLLKGPARMGGPG